MYSLAFIVSFLITMIITPVVILFANHFKLVDDPKKRYHPASVHVGIIPRAGGIAILIGILVTSFLLVPLTGEIIGILIASVLFVIVGILDDWKDISPKIRLVSNALIIAYVIFSGIHIPYITNPFTGGTMLLTNTISIPFIGIFPVLSYAITFLWLYWTTNIVGWSAGVDGQMPGFVTIASIVIGLLSIRYSSLDSSQMWVTNISFIVSGTFLGFLVWNFYPQKIMPGYSGKTLAGFLLGILAILSYSKVGTALLVLGIPMIDAVYTIVRRLIHNKPLTKADRGHLHHLLLDKGWGKRRIALFYWFVSAILGTIALTITSTAKVFALLIVLVIVLGFFVWVGYFSSSSKQHDQDNG